MEKVKSSAEQNNFFSKLSLFSLEATSQHCWNSLQKSGGITAEQPALRAALGLRFLEAWRSYLQIPGGIAMDLKI